MPQRRRSVLTANLEAPNPAVRRFFDDVDAIDTRATRSARQLALETLDGFQVAFGERLDPPSGRLRTQPDSPSTAGRLAAKNRKPTP